MLFSDEDRRRHIKAKIATSNSLNLHYLRKSFERKLKHGYVSQELHDFVIQEINKVRITIESIKEENK